MAKKPSKPAKKSAARTRGKSRPTATRAGRRPARRSTQAARTARGKRASTVSTKKRSTAKPVSRGSVRTKKRPAPRAAGRTMAKGKVSSQAHDKSKPANRKAVPAKAPPKVVAKPAPKPGKPVAKIQAKVPPVPGKAGVAATPGKPSAGEIAARLSAKRTEKALAEGKARSGKNGGVELRKVELTPAEAEARKTRLKNLIVLGKERSYLTYAEINDHLPDDILDAEQIEGIISMINDMGIQVYDEAPDAETLLMSEAAPTTAADDVDEEAAEAAASTSAEFEQRIRAELKQWDYVIHEAKIKAE